MLLQVVYQEYEKVIRNILEMTNDNYCLGLGKLMNDGEIYIYVKRERVTE